MGLALVHFQKYWLLIDYLSIEDIGIEKDDDTESSNIEIQPVLSRRPTRMIDYNLLGILFFSLTSLVFHLVIC